MFCADISAPIYFIFSSSAPSLLYYSHIPAIIISLLLGFFVYFKSNKSLSGKMLLFVALLFFIWSFFSLITWVSVDSRLISFVWSFSGVVYILIYLYSLYFIYSYFNEKRVPARLRSISFILVLPIVLFSFTKYNLEYFDLAYCEASESSFYYGYYYLVSFAFALMIIIMAIMKYRKVKEKNEKKKILLITFGVELFLLSFFFTGFLASYFVDKGIIEDFGLEFYGLFGMTFFMGVLAFMIVKYKVFNIKLIGAQALVVALIILIGSQFAFIQTRTNMILNGITFILVCSFGWILIKSVKAEVERKEQLQIMTEKLAVANDKLRKLDNAKTEFISIASHQLRTPLTAVKGYVSLILEGSYGPITPNQKNVLSNIVTSNERLINLVEDLLNISRIESGRMEFNFAPCNVADLCREIYDTFVLKAKDRNLFLKIDLVRALELQVTTDRNKLREVISNLVDNAIKYTPSGGVKMRAYRNDDKVRIEVTDTGIGIPETEMPYLFAKFSRGKDTSRLNAGGTGLGLHVGKSMIEALHGKIWAESEGDKKGSTFIVELPIKYQEDLK